MLVFGKHKEIGRRHEGVVEWRNCLKVVSGCQLTDRLIFFDLTVCELIRFELALFDFGGNDLGLFKLGSVEKRSFNLFGHQAVSANLGNVEGMGFVEADVENSSERSILINRHNEQRIGAELAANVSFDAGVGLGIFDSQNFTISFCAGGDGQGSGHLVSNQGGAGSASSAVRQAISLQQGNGDTAGIGHVARRIHDVSHYGINVKLATGEESLNLHDCSERVGIDLAFLHRKSVGQKLLKSFAVVGWTGHTAVTLSLATLAGERAEPP